MEEPKQEAQKIEGKKGWGLLARLRRAGFLILMSGLLLVGILALSVTFLFLYHQVLASPYVRLEHLDMRGVDPDLESEIKALAGLYGQVSLLAINLEKVKRKVEEHPWVRSAELERRLPRTLVVTVERQIPAAIVAADRLYLMNQQGEIFKVVGPLDRIDFPVITGPLEEIQQNPGQLKEIAHLLEIVKHQDGDWGVENLSEIHIRHYGDISLYFNHLKAEIRVPLNHFADRLDGLKRVAEHLKTTGRIGQASRINLYDDEGAIVAFEKG